MVPYSAFMHMEKRQGPNEITRYNLYNSATIRAIPSPGYTTGDAIKVINEVAERVLPRGYDVGWEGLSFDEAQRGNDISWDQLAREVLQIAGVHGMLNEHSDFDHIACTDFVRPLNAYPGHDASTQADSVTTISIWL